MKTTKLVCCVFCVLEYSLRYSKHEQLKSVVIGGDDDDDADVDEIVRTIAAVKRVDVAVSPA